jgi:hypothetical protein
MELYNLIQTICIIIFIPTVLFFGKQLIIYFFDATIELKKAELNQDLENHKKKLEQESKDFQHSLDLRLNDFNIRFSKLHQDRAEVIKELYYKVIELQSAMTIFTRRGQLILEDADKENEERVERVNKGFYDYINFYLPNKIYFDRKLAEKLDFLAKNYRDKSWNYGFLSNDIKKENLPAEVYKEIRDEMKKISKFVDEEFPKVIEELEDEFRSLLGVK